MTAVWALDLASSEKFVLLALADNANDEGSCWPSAHTIASKTNLSIRTVRGAIHKLEQGGHLTISERYGRSNIFIVTPAATAPLQPLHPAAVAPHPGNGCTPPLQPLQATPADAAPITVKEPPSEPPKEPSRGRAPASRIPDDFLLTPERRQFAEKENLIPERTFDAFRDYWVSLHGSKGLKLDWDATWRGWCRREGDGKTKTNTPRKTRYEEMMEKLNAS